jgi:hypothetical protein
VHARREDEAAEAADAILAAYQIGETGSAGPLIRERVGAP